MNADAIKSHIQRNGNEISRLQALAKDAYKHREKNRAACSDACAAFHGSFDRLAFPGGYHGATKRIMAGYPATIENALCFLELRPYFFRSGYIWNTLLPKVKKADLSPRQRERLDAVLLRRERWRALQRAGKN